MQGNIIYTMCGIGNLCLWIFISTGTYVKYKYFYSHVSFIYPRCVLKRGCRSAASAMHKCIYQSFSSLK